MIFCFSGPRNSSYPRTGDLVRKRKNLAVRGTPFQYWKGWQVEKYSVIFCRISIFQLGIRKD